jgi:hypothetical protein
MGYPDQQFAVPLLRYIVLEGDLLYGAICLKHVTESKDYGTE